MPYFEVRFIKPIDHDRFDVFDESFVEEHDHEADASGWDAFVPIDYEKLSRYIRIQLVTRQLIHQESQYVTVDFRRCTLEDFENNEYVGDPPLALEQILCP